MRKGKVIHKMEFFILISVFISFVWILTVEEKYQPISDPNEFFIDLNLSGTFYNGEEPEGDGTGYGAGPWCNFSQINWGNQYLEYIYVFAKTNGNSHQLTSAISPTKNDVTIIGVKDLDDSIYWPPGYNYATSYPKIEAHPNYDINIVDLTSNGTGTIFQNFIFNGDDDEIAVIINQSDGSQFINCEIYSNGDDINASGMVICANDSDNLIFRDCKLISNNNISNNILFFSQCDNLIIEDCSTETSKDCAIIITIANSTSCTFIRNKFHLDTNNGCVYGINLISSSHFNFTTNSVYASCSIAAVNDQEPNIGGSWNCNTIYNTFSSDDTNHEGYGYWGNRLYHPYGLYRLSSFRNNIVLATSDENEGYAIYIDCDLSYWQPMSATFSHNCYYGDVNSYFGYIDGTTYNDINSWEAATNDNDSVFDDPNILKIDVNLNVDGYHLDVSQTPDSVKYGGIRIIGIEIDIDKGEYAPSGSGKISIGCDQYFYVDYTVYGATLNTAPTPPKIELGIVDTPYIFVLATYHYGYPNPKISDVTISTLNPPCGFIFLGPSIPIYIDYRSSEYLDFGFDPSSAGVLYTEDLEIEYDLGYTIQKDDFKLEGEGN